MATMNNVLEGLDLLRAYTNDDWRVVVKPYSDNPAEGTFLLVAADGQLEVDDTDDAEMMEKLGWELNDEDNWMIRL